MIPDTIPLPNGTHVYFAKCPKCGNHRSLNDKKAGAFAAISAGGILTAIVFGAPLLGLFAIVGAVKLVAAGIIATPVAVKILQENYRLLEQVGDEKWFMCDKCKCSDLLR